MARWSTYIVILAGGDGGGLWPLSTVEHPKQFVDFFGSRSTLLQTTYARFASLCPPEHIFVVTNRAYLDFVKQQLPDIDARNILSEPCARGTAPSVAYASWRIKMLDPKANVVVTPCDHVVADVPAFREALRKCLAFTAGTDAAVVLGVRPTAPETSYGYVHADLSSHSPRSKEIFRVDMFKEKPDAEWAERNIALSSCFWNAGIYVWSVGTIVNAFRVYSPRIGRIFESIAHLYGTDEEQPAIDARYPECDRISLDCAIAEHLEEMYICPIDCGWGDIGSWQSVLMHGGRDVYGNSVTGDGARLYETHDSVVHVPDCERAVVQGLDGYVVAETDGELLVKSISCHLDL